MTDEALNLTDEKRAELGQRIMGMIRSAREAMATLLEKMDDWDNLYESNLPGKDFPWEGASNVNIPLIQSHVDTWHASINNTVFAVEPIVLVRPPAAQDTVENRRIARAVERALQTVEADWMDIESMADQWHLNALSQPVGVVKVVWREERKNVRRTRNGQRVTERVLKYRGPKLENVDVRNFVVYPLYARNKDEATLIGDCVKLTKDQLQRGVRDGVYRAEWADEIESALTIEGVASGQLHTDSESQEDREYVDSTDQAVYTIWEVITGYDFNGDGLEEDCVFALEESTGTIIRAIEYPYWHGIRYYGVLRPFPRPGQRFFGRTLGQILEHLQHELNAIHNQRVDATTLAISPPFLQLRGSQTRPGDVVFHPGAVIPVDTKDELVQLQVNPLIPGMDIEANAKEWSERASPISDLAAGKPMTGRKTATEVSIVGAQGGMRINDCVRRIQEDGWADVHRQVLGLMHQFLSDEELQALGVQRDWLEIPWRLIPHGTLSLANKQQQQQYWTAVVQMLSTNPLFQPLIAADPIRVYRLAESLLRAFDTDDPETYIGTEDELVKQVMGGQQQVIEELLAKVAMVLGMTPEQMHEALQKVMTAETMGGEGGQIGVNPGMASPAGTLAGGEGELGGLGGEALIGAPRPINPGAAPPGLDPGGIAGLGRT